jgi:hypothetical protein
MILEVSQGEKVRYSDFLSATIDPTKVITESGLNALFHTFAKDGEIKASDIQVIFSKFN